jgi:hypothetical protein
LKHPHTSGALDKKSTGAENATGGKLMLDLGSAVESETSQQPNASINGQPGVPYYIVGTDGSQGNMILRGTVKDLINSIDAGFYAASWPGKSAAMTISHMQLYIDGVQFAEHGDFQDGMQTILHEALWYLGDAAWLLFKRQILKKITPGIPRDPTDGMLVNLTQFIDPTTITFNGLVECGASADKTQIILLNEEYFYKGITADLIDYFLNDDSPNTTGGKFIYNNIKPTFQGLYDIVNNKTSAPDSVNNNGKTYAENTIDAIYGKLESVLATKTFDVGSYITLEFKHMFTALFPTKDELINKLPNMEVELTISTCPYHSNKAQGYGSKANPIPLNSISGTVYPIVFWGLNAN